MRFVIKCLIIAAVLAAPCAYDVNSHEPAVISVITGTVSSTSGFAVK